VIYYCDNAAFVTYGHRIDGRHAVSVLELGDNLRLAFQCAVSKR
jgi:hypothetical protein